MNELQILEEFTSAVAAPFPAVRVEARDALLATIRSTTPVRRPLAMPLQRIGLAVGVAAVVVVSAIAIGALVDGTPGVVERAQAAIDPRGRVLHVIARVEGADGSISVGESWVRPDETGRTISRTGEPASDCLAGPEALRCYDPVRNVIDVYRYNPEAVEAAINYGAKCVWMPSLHAAGHQAHYGSLEYENMTMKFTGKRRPVRGITIFDSDRRILPDVYDILSMVRDADIILATGQLTIEEIFALIRGARDVGITKLLVEHAEAAVTKLTPDEQAQLAEMGATIQHAYAVVFYHETSIKEVAQSIKKHGAVSGVLATDCGNVYNPHPIEAMRLFITMLIRAGITRDEIVLMTQKVPASLLNLD